MGSTFSNIHTDFSDDDVFDTSPNTTSSTELNELTQRILKLELLQKSQQETIQQGYLRRSINREERRKRRENRNKTNDINNYNFPK
jgi:hypothetical protein